MRIKIRKAKISELRKILELQKKQNLLHQGFEPKFYLTTENFEKKWMKLTKEKLNKKGHILLVAIDGNKIVGFIWGSVKERPLRKVKRYGSIEEIFIEETYRGRGIGTKLINSLIKWLKIRNISHIEFWVNLKNKKAIKFYKGLGFKEYEKIMKKYI